ncbi:sigma-70 family RNA polymerase sigma factor [soil metagenome]
MQFAPHDTRLGQIAAAEDLLHSLDPAKAYPPDFVVFRITGYRRKGAASGELLTGVALQHDLGLLIEQISDTLNVQTASLVEPVLAIDDVTEKFNVTSKTIQRWRRRGLPARRFIFPDGRRRVGFLLSSVERFLGAHHEQVDRGSNFSQVSDGEREEILRRARRLATGCHCCTNEISRRIGRRLNRSPLTVLHTVRKHDEEHPDHAIFKHAGEAIGDDERGLILRKHRHGTSIKALARRLGQSRNAIYRVIVEERIARLNRRKTRFIDDPLYHEATAADTIEQIVRQEPLAGEFRPEENRIPRDLPPYLADLYRTPLLTPPQERALFLKFNFHKYQFVQARRRLEPQFARARDLNVLEGHLRLASDTKNAIVRANLRLVVSIARKHLRPGYSQGLSLMELISDGNITLMRAVESFDVHKGNRFSTYATLALMKGFARSVPMMLAEQYGATGAGRAGARTGGRTAGLGAGKIGLGRREMLIPDLADPRIVPTSQRISQRDEVRSLLARLEPRERAVLAAHFGLSDSADSLDQNPSTYEQLRDQFGLSVQRIRQIERAALAKLRASAT